MTLESELTVTILTQSETVLGFLNTETIEIEEGFTLYGLRTLTITHPLMDKQGIDETKYSSMLLNGNKLWRTLTCDGASCLYVILKEPEINYKNHTIKVVAEEVAGELSQLPPIRSENFEWTVDSTFINLYFGDLFDSGTLAGPGTTTQTVYNGMLTPMEILRKIEEKTGGEFQFRYEYDTDTLKIKRYIDYFPVIGSVHTEKITLDKNAIDITPSVDESDTRIGAAPKGEPNNDKDEFHKNMKEFEDEAISTSVQIPLYVTQDENGDPLNGPMVYPPYPKPSGQNYVVCDVTDELVANYTHITHKEGSSTTTPRIYTFTTSETNKYNIFWDCVDNLREHLEPEINITCGVIDIKKINDDLPEYYNVGDIVYLELPIYGTVLARISETTKNPRKLDGDNITISNYQTSFLNKNYKSAGMIDLSS